MSKTYEFSEEKTFRLPVREVWEVVADTNQLNRYVGLFAVDFKPFQTDAKRIIRKAKATAFGLVPIEWVENVFEWVNESHYSVERIYTTGPMERVIWKVSVLEEDADRTTVKLEGRFTYRNLIGQAALHFGTLPQLRKILEYVAIYENIHKNDRKTSLSRSSATVDKARLDGLAERLTELFDENDMIQRLLNTLQTAPDENVNKLQPYKWADDFGFERTKTIELFLLANEVGLVNYEWSMMCPNCRVPKDRVTSLKLMKTSIHCDLCGVDYEMDFDRYIEMTFTVHPSVRKVNNEIYCINGPANSPHIVGQFRVGPKEEIVVKWNPLNDNMRLRVLRNNAQAMVDAYNGLKEQVIKYGRLGFSQQSFDQADAFTIINDSEEEIVLAIEKTEWDAFALTAREVTSLQLFRNLLPAEVLAPGVEIGVGTLTVLFTDLKGSTKLYEEIGDALAYADVKRHFDYLEKQIAAHKGTIVKTIGDSVMAVFITDDDALSAALAIQREMDELNQVLSHPISIKIGFHTGPVIAVNANDVLDYFGRTVNLAARVQHQSVGDDIVLTKEVYESLSGHSETLQNCTIQPFTEILRGMEKEIALIRIKKVTGTDSIQLF